MIKTLLRKFRFWLFREQDTVNERLLLALGRIEARQVLAESPTDLRRTEFRVYSQNGEDGVLQYLTAKVPLGTKSFVEFGTQDYRESNTRLLAAQDHWSGTIIDGGRSHLEFLYRRSFLGYDRNITALQAFITKDNINALLDQAAVPDDLGLLSVDIDGNDFWVLKAILTGRVRPRLVVVEYNSLFGADLAVSVPYAPVFERFNAHTSGLYWGASLAAFHGLLDAQGYALVYCESHGTNAFFVRRELLGDLKELSVKKAFVGYQLRAPGGLVPLREKIGHLPLEDTRTGAQKALKDCIVGH